MLGNTNEIVSDNGSYFVNQAIQQLSQCVGIYLIVRTTPKALEQ